MRNSTRVIVNTGAQYLRSILQVVITLYTSRVILESLGVNDYGIYTLVGGVVSMLSFIQSNLAKTNQRFLNYYHGKADSERLRCVFNNSVITQIIICFVLVGGLLALTDVVFNYLLNIAPERLDDAKKVYYIMLIMLMFNLLSTPFYAVLIANENIVYSSIVQVGEAILKIPIAISLLYFFSHKLVAYSWMMCGISALNFVCYTVFALRRYPECKEFSFRSFNFQLWKEMMGFMVWGIYGTFCVVGRSQGIAIILNRAFSTAINAAYGIGTQVVGQLSFVSVAITTAMNPQIVKAEGSGNRARVFRLAEISTKYSFLLISVLLIPVYVYIEPLLSLWLKSVPEYTAMFCRFIIITVLLDWVTQGLVAVNTAVGNVRTFSLLVNTVSILAVPAAWVWIKVSPHPESAMMAFAIFSGLTSVVRVVYLKFNIGLSIQSYLKQVLFPIIPITIISVYVCNIIYGVLPVWGIVIAFILSIVVTMVGTFIIGLNDDERIVIDSILHKIFKKNNAEKTK